jgi:hypothetical protein
MVCNGFLTYGPGMQIAYVLGVVLQMVGVIIGFFDIRDRGRHLKDHLARTTQVTSSVVTGGSTYKGSGDPALLGDQMRASDANIERAAVARDERLDLLLNAITRVDWRTWAAAVSLAVGFVLTAITGYPSEV